MQEKNSNPVIEFSNAKLDNCLSSTEVPEIIVLSSSLDKCEKFLPSLIIIPGYPPSLISVFEPTPRTLIGRLFENFFKKKLILPMYRV